MPRGGTAAWSRSSSGDSMVRLDRVITGVAQPSLSVDPEGMEARGEDPPCGQLHSEETIWSMMLV